MADLRRSYRFNYKSSPFLNLSEFEHAQSSAKLLQGVSPNDYEKLKGLLSSLINKSQANKSVPLSSISKSLNPLVNKADYDKYLLDLILAGNIDKKIIEILQKEAIEIFRNHQQAKEAILAHLREIRSKTLDRLQSQDEAYMREKEAALQKLQALLSELDSSVIKSLENCLSQINILQDKQRKIEKQKEAIYENLGQDIAYFFNKPEYNINGKNPFKINKNLPLDVQKGMERQIGKVFNQELAPLNDQIHQLDDKVGKIELKREISNKKLKAVELEKLDKIDTLTQEAPNAMLDAMKVFAKQDDTQEEDQRSINEIAKAADEQFNDNYNEDTPLFPLIVDGEPIYDVDPEVLTLTDENKDLSEEDNAMTLLYKQLEEAEAIINQSANRVSEQNQGQDQSQSQEEEVQFGPPSFDEHLHKLGYKGAVIRGNIDEKSVRLIENKVMRQELKEKKEKLKDKIEKLEKNIEEIKKLGIISFPMVLHLKELAKIERKKYEKENQKLEQIKQEAEQLKEEKQELIQKFDLTVAKLVSSIDYINSEMNQDVSQVTDFAMPAAGEITAAGASSSVTADVVKLGAQIRAGLDQNPDFMKKAAAQIGACDAAQMECATQIAGCQAMARELVDSAIIARKAIAGEYDQVAGAPMMTQNHQLEGLISQVRSTPAQDARKTSSLGNSL